METVPPDLTLEDAMRGIVQGFPGAHIVLKGLKETFPQEDWLLIVRYLYECGPRGPGLWERFTERCSHDTLTLGRDLLAQDQERRGWPEQEK